MNKVMTILCCFIILGCLNIYCSSNGGSKDISNEADTVSGVSKIDSMKIYKIDSINNFYLIYGIKNGSHYKIVSEKVYNPHCDRIQKGNYYNFELTSMLYTAGNIDVAPGHIGCAMVDNRTKICIEDSIYDLYAPKNFKGLCFEKEE